MDSTKIRGLLEIKCPYSMKDKNIPEACKSSSFCLEDSSTHKLKRRHNYYYQIQCQLHCVDCEWCDFVVKTSKDIHTQRIYRNKKWWEVAVVKLKELWTLVFVKPYAICAICCGSCQGKEKGFMKSGVDKHGCYNKYLGSSAGCWLAAYIHTYRLSHP